MQPDAPYQGWAEALPAGLEVAPPNGHPPAAAPPSWRPGADAAGAPRLIPTASAEWVTLPAPYDGLHAHLRLDFSEREWQTVLSDDLAVQRAALGAIVLEHDGWADAEGPLPPPQDAAFWERLPRRVLLVLIGLISRESQRLPPALLARIRSG